MSCPNKAPYLNEPFSFFDVCYKVLVRSSKLLSMSRYDQQTQQTYLYTPVYLIESVKIMKIWYCKTYFFISLIQLSCKMHAILKRISFFFITENGQDFYPGYQGYNDFFPGQGDGGPPPMNFLPPTSQGTPPLSMEQSLHHNSKYILRLSNSC